MADRIVANVPSGGFEMPKQRIPHREIHPEAMNEQPGRSFAGRLITGFSGGKYSNHALTRTDLSRLVPGAPCSTLYCFTCPEPLEICSPPCAPADDWKIAPDDTVPFCGALLGSVNVCMIILQ